MSTTVEVAHHSQVLRMGWVVPKATCTVLGAPLSYGAGQAHNYSVRALMGASVSKGPQVGFIPV